MEGVRVNQIRAQEQLGLSPILTMVRVRSEHPINIVVTYSRAQQGCSDEVSLPWIALQLLVGRSGTKPVRMLG